MVSLKKKRLVFTIDRFFHIQKGVFMNIFKYKGKRIRASDKNLVYRFCVGTLLLLFVAVLLLLNMGQLMRTDWEHFSLLDNGGWTGKDEEDLLNFLKLCDEKQIRFALSNVLEHKGKIHDKLLKWCLSNGFNINYINNSYKNSNYHIKDKSLITREVLITNY